MSGFSKKPDIDPTFPTKNPTFGRQLDAYTAVIRNLIGGFIRAGTNKAPDQIADYCGVCIQLTAKCRVFGWKCRVDVGFFRETRHQFSKQNQSLRGKMSGMAGFSRMREVLRKRAAFFFVHGRGRPASTFGLQLDSKPRVRRGVVSVSL